MDQNIYIRGEREQYSGGMFSLFDRENRPLENCETSRSATREFRLLDREGEVVRTMVER